MTGDNEFDIPDKALTEATKAYVEAWQWTDQLWDQMSERSQENYKEKIKIAIQTFIKAVNE